MTHTYKISGMTCQHCVARVQKALASHPEVSHADVILPSVATVTMKRHLSEQELQEAVSKAGPYTIHAPQHS
jgi:Cu2+-exporting ATPase